MFDFLFLFLGRPSMSMVVNSQLITQALAENEALRVWNVPLIVSVHPNISQKARGKVSLHASRRDEVRGKVYSLLSEACEKVSSPKVSKPKACHYLAGDRENENSCWQQGNVPFFFLVTPMGEILRKSYKRRGPTPSPFYILFLTDKVPLFYTFYWEMVPLLTYVVYNFDVISLPFCICLL